MFSKYVLGLKEGHGRIFPDTTYIVVSHFSRFRIPRLLNVAFWEEASEKFTSVVQIHLVCLAREQDLNVGRSGSTASDS